MNFDEPDLPSALTLAAPSGLRGHGLKEWRRLAGMLSERGVLTEADLAAFEDYCRALTNLRQYEQKATRVGLELAIAKGYAGLIVKLRSQVSQLRAGLGLTPSSRSSVKSTQKNGGATSRVRQFMEHSR